jgi:hypothetical protein
MDGQPYLHTHIHCMQLCGMDGEPSLVLIGCSQEAPCPSPDPPSVASCPTRSAMSDCMKLAWSSDDDSDTDVSVESLRHRHGELTAEDDVTTSHNIDTLKRAEAVGVCVDVIGCRFLPGEAHQGYRVSAGIGSHARITAMSNTGDLHPLFIQRLKVTVPPGEHDVVVCLCEGSGRPIGSVRIPLKTIRNSVSLVRRCRRSCSFFVITLSNHMYALFIF